MDGTLHHPVGMAHIKVITSALCFNACPHDDHDDCPDEMDEDIWCKAKVVLRAIDLAGLIIRSQEDPIG